MAEGVERTGADFGMAWPGRIFGREPQAEDLPVFPWVLMGTLWLCLSRCCDPGASPAAANTRGKAIQRRILQSQCCLRWDRGSPEAPQLLCSGSCYR